MSDRGTCRECGASPIDFYICETCRQIINARQERRTAAGKRAAETRRRNNPNWCVPKSADLIWQGKAQAYVSAAKRMGVLPALDGSIACVDCGKPAAEYEHRDYSRPLDVEPVCNSCNAKRGTAKWPSAADFNFKRIEHA